LPNRISAADGVREGSFIAMNTSKICLIPAIAVPARHASRRWLAAALVGLLGVSCDLASSWAQQAENDTPGTQILTRGPVHEAFAGMVAFNPDPGLVVTKAPPEGIEEVPPDARPEGDNVTWIPGYWAWDDERSDFLWVSGTWRALPPGRQWMAGYWAKTPQGYQWTSGYWADATAREITYLPPPPATVEAGPNIAAPSVDYTWSPGCWLWYQGRYAWGPGYWAQGRADWDWMPAHYAWSPRGFIFVGGYWDYPVPRRGVLFAPVYFDAGVYSRRGYYYSPRIAIDLGVFTDHLFLRPRFCHYYFGDYYATSYAQGGFYAAFAFQSSRYGYDPIYSHQRWTHRLDREWEHRAEAAYQYRRDNETARPPRTWAAQKNINPGTAESKQNHVMVATSIDQLAHRKDGAVRFQPVAKEERQKLAQRGQAVQKSRDERRTLEAKAVAPTTQRPGAAFEPAKVPISRSPLVGKSASQFGRKPSPPKSPPTPKPNLGVPSKPESSGRPPNVDRSDPQSEPRKAQAEDAVAPRQIEAAPREWQVQPAMRQRANTPAVKASEESPRNTSGMEPQAQRISEQPAPARPGAGEKGATKLLKSDRQKQEQGRFSPHEKPTAP